MKKKMIYLSGLLLILIVVSCCCGRYELSVKQILQLIIGKNDNAMDQALFYRVRLARTFFVVLSGAALSLAGMVYQTLFRNPLVSPDILGVSSGCSIGAILMILGTGVSASKHQFMPLLFGLVTVGITILLAKVFQGDRRYMMVLAGIIIGSLANSIIMLLKYIADPNRQLPAIEYWLMGTFQNVNWKSTIDALPWILPAILILYLIRWKMNVILLEEDEARSLGIQVSRLRMLAITAATILVAAVVSKAGIIAWIGLIAPHIARRITGDKFSNAFWASLLTGAILLLLSDILARSLFTAEIPISILTSFLGALILSGVIIAAKCKRI